MSRAFLFILDSFGIGGAPDAEKFGDAGSNTLGHIAAACIKGKADKKGLRSGPLSVPNLESLGLGLAAENTSGVLPAGFNRNMDLRGQWANAAEISSGKDTPSGHWEIAGVPVLTDWGYFPDLENSFPQKLLEAIVSKSNIPGYLGNKHASGTVIIEELGEESIKSGKPIFYTSSDSVFQIAAHEEHFGLERLYALCESVFELTAPMNIGRVIARPFIGNSPADFKRTGNRRDFSISPPKPTLLDVANEAGRDVIAIGKIADIYAHSGPTEVIKANGNAALGEATLKAMKSAADGALLITNFVDFDMLYGHRRDVAGYANALEEFDRFLPRLIAETQNDDVMVLTADHGCDPTWTGTDHTREQVPVLLYGPKLKPDKIGSLNTFADIGASIADHLGLSALSSGKSFLKDKASH